MGLRFWRRSGEPSSAMPPVQRWRHRAKRHGSNLLGGLMVMVMLYAVALTLSQGG
jgi:hypothetical protein